MFPTLQTVSKSVSILLLALPLFLGPAWAGKVGKGKDAPAELKITDLKIEVTENGNTFVSDSSNDPFDPFWDDQLVGGRENLGGDGGQQFAVVTNANATTASTNVHTANVKFNLTVAATVDIAVFRDYNWPYSNVLVQDVSTAPYSGSAGPNSIGHWMINDEEPGDYFANVCAYRGSVGQAGYQEVGGHTTVKPLSPSSQNTRTSADASSKFYIERQPWGSVRDIEFDETELIAKGFTDSEWDLVQLGTWGSTAVGTGFSLIKMVRPGIYALALSLLVEIIDHVDVLNGVIPSNGQPAGARRKNPNVSGDENDILTLKTWAQDVWEWSNTSNAQGGYQAWYDDYPFYVWQTGSWEYADYRRPSMGASGHGYSWLDWAEFTNNSSDSVSPYSMPTTVGYMVTACPYWMPPGQQGTGAEMIFDPPGP